MIVSCPECDARFRIDGEKLAGKRLTLRCAKCRAPFKVELPHRGRSAAPGIRVMVAHTDRELCGTIGGILESAGMECLVSHDGEAALRLMDATPPQVAVVDVALQGLYAFEVVDKVRRRPGLGGVKIILLSSVYNKMAYKRSPSSLYGADDYIEKHHIPDDLVPKINRLVVGAAPATVPAPAEEEQTGKVLSSREAEQQSVDYIHRVNEKILSAENRQVDSDGELSDMERARRLARIIVSDIALYYQERVDEGIRGGNWAELLEVEIQEARKLFRERFPDERIQQARILEAAFVDLLERRRSELSL
ncbi:MAG: response regulator [Deltaproteobacteria bacterium]|nr:MAG: response regulator [Deltaproteobacteria bacterium]